MVKRKFFLIYSMVFISGFSIMSVELIAGKLLAPHFGSSVYVWGSIITVFMLALSMGYLLGGRLSVRTESYFLYSVLFASSGLFIFLTPWLKGEVFAMSSFIRDPRYGSLIASLLLFFPLSLFLGMISPYSIRLLAFEQSTSGKIAGNLYFFSTIGSTIGTILASFYLVLWFELDQLFFGIGILMISQSLLPAIFLSRN